MSRNARAKRVNKRKDKIEREEPKVVNQKFEVQYKKNVPPIKALNDKQQSYIYSINCNPLTVATGFAGTSKTFIPTCIASDMLREGTVERIILTRPNISSSKSLGFFGGDLNEKMRNWLMPVLDTLNDRLGPSMVDYCIKVGKIEFVPLEVIKGRSFRDAFIIVDEAEDITYKESVSIITRLGKNSKMVLAGDITQKDLTGTSGLSIILEMAKEDSGLNCGWVDFNEPSDIVRSETVKKWILSFVKRERGER